MDPNDYFTLAIGIMSALIVMATLVLAT